MNRTDHVVADQEAVFHLLADPATYGLAGPVTRIDTHGAVVFLAGENVYKVKRAVRFPFMDLSTLGRRHQACLREIEVNRPGAPDIYLGLVPITRRDERLQLGGEGTIVEWAVHMRRFDETMTLDRVVANGGLTSAVLAALARAVAASHEAAQRKPDTDSSAAMRHVAAELVEGLREAPDLFPPIRLTAFSAHVSRIFDRLSPLLDERARRGEVRRCHGDLHLRNIALINGRPVLFDALEFDEALATIDRLYDIAFLLMDIGVRGLGFEANQFLNRYLVECWNTPPFDGLAALPLFIALRAAIRARVAAAGRSHRTEVESAAIGLEAASYFAFAENALRPRPPRLVAIGGLSGTGKSTLAASLAPSIGPLPGAVHLRSDVERKRLHGIPELERLPAEAYSPEATQAVYETLRLRAGVVLRAGHGVIVDAVHQRPDERAAIEAVAHACGVEFVGLWLEAPVKALTARVDARRGDASDATADIVRAQAERDIGPMNWARIDADGSPAEVRARAWPHLAPAAGGHP